MSNNERVLYLKEGITGDMMMNKSKKKKRNTRRETASRKLLEKRRKKALNRGMSPMEKKISIYLRNRGLRYKREYVHKTLFNPQTKHSLYIDFYIPILKLAIEYDGKHHFQNEDGEMLAKQKYRDSIKDEWCRVNNISLLRIPYMEQDDFIDLINNKINSLR